MTYRYVYDPSGEPADEEGRYDEATRVIIRKNVAQSQTLDPQRVDLGPTASQLRARVVSDLATENGHGGKP
jgi:hypothetical protein